MRNAVGLRVSSLLRHARGATVALAVFAGIAGGVAMGTWSMARRTATSFDRFTAYADHGQLTLFTCGLGETPDFTSGGPACPDYDYTDVLAFLHGLPAVRSAGRLTLTITGLAPEGQPARWIRQLVAVPVDPEATASLGRSILVAGRLPRATSATELVENEVLRDQMGLGVGARVVVTPYRLDEFDAAGESREPPHGPPRTMTVVGVVRSPEDLDARLGGISLYQAQGTVQVASAWWTATGGDVARYGLGVAIQLRDRATPADVDAAFRARWPGRFLSIDDGGVGLTGGTPQAREAISLEGRGLALIALVVAVAALVFAGQAIARQSRREWTDAAALSALGFTRASMRRAAAVRALTIAGPAGVTGAGVAVVMSPLGPVGLGRAAEVHPGVHVDWFVLGVGVPLLVVAVVAAGLAPITARSRGQRRRAPRLSSARLPPTMTAGTAMTTARRAGGLALGSAVAGVTLAATAGVAAWSLRTTYEDVVVAPVRYGADWDALVGNVSTPEQQQRTEQALRAIPGIRAAGLDNASGGPGGTDFTLTTFRPLEGSAPEPVVTAGRAPANDHEVALGRTTMRRLRTSLGATIHLPPGDPSQGKDVTVVGEAIINDGFGRARPGDGGYVTSKLFDQLVPDSHAAAYAVWVQPGADRRAALDAVRAAFPTTYTEPFPPTLVRNFDVVGRQPIWLAAVVAAFAVAALIHALGLSVHASRRQIGVLKALGFTRRQAAASVAWHASFLAAIGVAIGLPAGAVVARQVWTAVARVMGLRMATSVPASAVLAVGLVSLVVANAAALAPGLAAVRVRPAVALREP